MTECKRALRDWKRALLVAAKHNHGYETVDPSCHCCVLLADLILSECRAARIEALTSLREQIVSTRLRWRNDVAIETAETIEDMIDTEIVRLKGEPCQKK